MAHFPTYLRRLSASSFLRRVRQAPAYYGHGLYQQLMHKDIFLWAQAIAFKVLITIVPVLILAAGVLGQFLQREKPFEAVSTFARNFMPPEKGDDIINALRAISSAGDFYTIVGVLGLLLSAMTLMTTLRVSISNVFQEDWHENRSILGGYLFDLRLVAQVGLFFILSFGLTLAVQTMNRAGFEFIEQVGLDYVWIREGWRRVLQMLGLVIPFLLTTAMFFQLLYFVPKPRPPKRSVLVGALFTAVLWEAAKSGFTLYATQIGRFDRYAEAGSEGARAYLGNTFGLIIAFVFWVYFSGVVLLLGAIVTLLHEKAHRSRREAALAAAQEQAAEAETLVPEAEDLVEEVVPEAQEQAEAVPVDAAEPVVEEAALAEEVPAEEEAPVAEEAVTEEAPVAGEIVEEAPPAPPVETPERNGLPAPEVQRPPEKTTQTQEDLSVN